MFKHIKISLSALFVGVAITSGACAGPNLNFQLGMGLMRLDNSIIRETFNKNFYINGALGLQDDSGWELRGNLGHFGDTSHNPDDLGYNLRVGITPLTASMIYHFNKGYFIQPYIGGGVGAYFFKIEDDVYGDHEAQTKFGPNLILGTRFQVGDSYNLYAEYNKHFIPQNYDSSIYSFGISVDLQDGQSQPQSQTQSAPSKKVNYIYTQQEEQHLVQIEQVTNEINEMKTQKKKLEKEIDDFYDSNTYDENSQEFVKEYRRVKHLENKIIDLDSSISKAQIELKSLQSAWQSSRNDSKPVEEHVVYLHDHYAVSPYGLRLKNNYFYYNDRPFKYRYYRNSMDRSQYNPHPQGNPPANVQPPAKAAEDRKEFAEKKKEYLKKLRQRGIE